MCISESSWLAAHAPAKGGPDDFSPGFVEGSIYPDEFKARARAWQRLLVGEGWAMNSSGSMDPSTNPVEKSSGPPLAGACASSQDRASIRNAASSGVSSKSTAPG